MRLGVADGRSTGGAFVPICPEEAVIVKIGIWAAAVWVPNGVKEGTTEEMGVLSCGSNEVLVTDGTGGTVEVEPDTSVCGKDVGVLTTGGGVFVRGCKRYDAVMAMAVLVLIAFSISTALAASPPEAIQMRTNKLINRPVTPNACK